jgi:hypothetical protein
MHLFILLLLFVFVDTSVHAQVEDKSELEAGENPDDKIKNNFFLKAEVSKTECFVGEPIMAVFKAYSRLDANSQVVKRPSLSGFSVIEMVDAYNNQPDVERYNGQYYYVHLIRKVQLFPLQAGTFTIEPAEVESVIHLRRTSRDRALRLRELFRKKDSRSSLDRQVTFKTPPVNITVNPVPEKDRPEDYVGAVGNFLVQVQMQDSVIRAREPALVKIIVSGTGNFPLITEPHVNWPASAEISGPTVKEQVNKYAYPLSGFKSYQFTIEHRDTGTFSIPPVKFSYFDPRTKKYKTAESNVVNYTVDSSSRQLKSNNDVVIFRHENDTPLHYYYFGVIVLVIVAVIIYFLMRPAKKN